MMMPLMMIMARNQSNLQIDAPLINLLDPMDQSTISFKKRSEFVRCFVIFKKCILEHQPRMIRMIILVGIPRSW